MLSRGSPIGGRTSATRRRREAKGATRAGTSWPRSALRSCPPALTPPNRRASSPPSRRDGRGLRCSPCGAGASKSSRNSCSGRPSPKGPRASSRPRTPRRGSPSPSGSESKPRAWSACGRRSRTAPTPSWRWRGCGSACPCQPTTMRSSLKQVITCGNARCKRMLSSTASSRRRPGSADRTSTRRAR